MMRKCGKIDNKLSIDPINRPGADVSPGSGPGRLWYLVT